MMTRLARVGAHLLLGLAIVAQGARSLAVDCPMHAAPTARSAHGEHGAPGGEGPRVPCGCTEACHLTVAAVPPGGDGPGNTRVIASADQTWPLTSGVARRGSHLRLPFATAPPQG